MLKRFRFIRLGSIWVSPLFIILLAGSFWGGYLSMFMIAYGSAMLHELAHIWAAGRLHVPVRRIEILPFGICGRLGVDFIRNPSKELIIAAAGPMMSGVLAVIFHLISARLPYSLRDHIEYARNINFALIALNLLPALPLDGGRMVKAVLSEHIGVIHAYNIALRLSRVIIFGIIAAAIALLLSSDFNFSLIMIGAFLLGSLASEQKNISLISLKEILYHKNKLKDSGLCRAEHIAADADEPARKLLRLLSTHKYYIIDVIDSSGRLTKSVTESQVLEALINQSIRSRFGDIR